MRIIKYKAILFFGVLLLVAVMGGALLSKAAPNATSLFLPIVSKLQATTPAPTPMPTPSGETDILIDISTPIGPAPETFGLNGWWTDEDALMWSERYSALNPEVVRVPILHALIEPINDDNDPTHINPDGFYFSTPYLIADDRHFTYSEWFRVLKENDNTIMVFIPYLSPWLSRAENTPILEAPYPPNDIAEYQELVQALLNYLIDTIGFSPDKIILEPVNEPDLGCGADPAVACFWDNWQNQELAEVIVSAAQTAREIDPRIRVAGPTLCCNFSLLGQLIQNYNLDNYLDIVTFHYYMNGGYNLSGLIDTYNSLQQYGKPVYLNEYGNTTYWSNGEMGALWHAAALSEFWQTGIPPIQFSMAEMPLMHVGYNELGLFFDWTQGWQIKPAYWVYVNFFNHLGNAALVHSVFPNGMLGIAGQQQSNTLALWIVNNSYQADGDIIIAIENWPLEGAQVQVFNNLISASPVDSFNTTRFSDGSLRISYPISPLNSFLFLLSAP